MNINEQLALESIDTGIGLYSTLEMDNSQALINLYKDGYIERSILTEKWFLTGKGRNKLNHNGRSDNAQGKKHY